MPSSLSQPFQTTQWTKVLSARHDSPAGKEALSELCKIYYGPVSLFVVRFRSNVAWEGVETAEDLTHAFFAQLLAGKGIANVDRDKGRFRSYLLGAVKHFLLDHFERSKSQRRGGKRTIQSLEYASGNGSKVGLIPVVDPDGFPSDAYFDREWALAVIDRSMQFLKQQFAAEQDSQRFDILATWLIAPGEGTSVMDACAQLKMSESAFRVSVHRLRKAFRRAVETQVAATLDDSATLHDEMRYLLSALSYKEPFGVGSSETN